MKTKTPKKPAAKPAKTPKPTPAPRIVRHEPEPERAEVAAARAIVQAVDEAEARAMLAGGPRPFALPPVPADFAAAVRPLLAAARLPAGSLPPTVARFAALVEEWERTSGPVAWEAWRELCRREFGRNWDAYRRAELARVSARVTADALRAFRRLSPDAARAAAEEARPRFADTGAAVLEYLAAPLPGMDADEDTASPRVFLSRIEDALAALADAARNPATPAASPSNAADAETVARIEAKVEAGARGVKYGYPLKKAAEDMKRSVRTLSRWLSNPELVPDEYAGFSAAALVSKSAFTAWKMGLGLRDSGANATGKGASRLIGDGWQSMHTVRRS